MGNPLKSQAPAEVYAPNLGKITQSPLRNLGNMASLLTVSIPSQVGPKRTDLYTGPDDDDDDVEVGEDEDDGPSILSLLLL